MMNMMNVMNVMNMIEHIDMATASIAIDLHRPLQTSEATSQVTSLFLRAMDQIFLPGLSEWVLYFDSTTLLTCLCSAIVNMAQGRGQSAKRALIFFWMLLMTLCLELFSLQDPPESP
jgi:hypothetical protein